MFFARKVFFFAAQLSFLSCKEAKKKREEPKAGLPGLGEPRRLKTGQHKLFSALLSTNFISFKDCQNG